MDGAAVMVGQENGLVGLLKKKILYLIYIHCVSHRCNLGTKDLVKIFNEIDGLNKSIYLLVTFLYSKIEK